MHIGKASVKLEAPVFVECTASVVGDKESEGPLGDGFDVVVKDPMFGEDTWEKAESRLQEMTVDKLFMKSGLQSSDVQYIFGGDLLGQLIATSFGVQKFEIPVFGLYGACSTFGEAMSLGALAVSAGAADRVIAVASSHFASAEKQFRFPLEYGNQRPAASTWTVTGCGAAMLWSGSDTVGAAQKSQAAKPPKANNSETPKVKITAFTTGKIVDYGVKDSMNMGAAMAPAAADLIENNIKDFEINAGYYDKIITGDLGVIGSGILTDMLLEKGIDISANHLDCGVMMYDAQTQDTKAGGSGCGCSASVFSSHIYANLTSGKWKRVLLVPTGALLSTVSYNEGQSVPGIAHGVVIESE
jgi:stage V sporulation protein AD